MRSQRTVQLGVLPPNGGLINTTANKTVFSTDIPKKQSKSIGSTLSTPSSSIITESTLAYSSINSHNQPLQYNKDLNLLTFFCNKSGTYNSATNSNKGNIICFYSVNDGTTWDSTLIYSNTNCYATLSGGAVHNPMGNTNPANAYLVSAAPLNNDTNWVGNFYASKTITFPGNNINSSDVQTILNKNLPIGGLQKHHLSYTDFLVTDGGIAHAVGELLNDPMATSNLVYGYRGAAIIKGSFVAGAFVWTNDSIVPNTKLRSDGSKYLYNQAMSTWNNLGTVGYVVFYGIEAGAVNENNAFQPIVYKTTNSGATWSKLPKLCFYAYISAGSAGCDLGGVKLNNLEAIASNTNLIKPFFSMREGADVTMDLNDNLHIFTNIISAASNHNDSLDYTYSYTPEKFSFKYVGNAYPTLWDVATIVNGYSLTKIDSIGTEGPSGISSQPGYTTNIWDDGKGGKLSLNARLQISRTYDGSKLFYTWSESDSLVAGGKWNIFPDIKMKGFDIASKKITPRYNVTTGITDADQQAYFHYAAPIVKNLTSTSWRLPIVYSNSIGNTLPYTGVLPIKHSLLNNIDVGITSFSVNTQYGTCNNTVGIAEKNLQMQHLNIYPNPSSEKVTIDYNDFKGEDNFKLIITNVLGQVIRDLKIEDIKTEILGLKSGIYFVNFYSKEKLVETRKIVVSN